MPKERNKMGSCQIVATLVVAAVSAAAKWAWKKMRKKKSVEPKPETDVVD